uniref:PFL domain-containing protein n=1 Tax=Mesocestoides corti TaxID=53468 RepID=A0A5K3FRL4_MESCO
MAIYEQHMQLVPQYIKLSEEIRRLSSVWDARVRQIVTRKQIEPSLVKNYEMRIKMYCELYATMLPYTAVAERKIASPKKRRGIFS